LCFDSKHGGRRIYDLTRPVLTIQYVILQRRSLLADVNDTITSFNPFSLTQAGESETDSIFFLIQ